MAEIKDASGTSATDRFERRLAELELIARESEKILRLVSHDMRNPLGAIIGMANLLSTDPTIPASEVPAMARVIEDSGRRMLALVENLLELSHIHAGADALQVRECDVRELIMDAANLVRPVAGQKKVVLEIGVDAGVGVRRLDREKVGQIITNLLLNAIKFSYAGFDTSPSRVQLQCWIGGIPTGEGTFLQLAIADNGIGIPEHLKPTIFDRFGDQRRSGTRGERGTGLGLAIVEHYVRLMHGEIVVHSAEGKGTTMEVIIPV